jgi:hypothetical protein
MSQLNGKINKDFCLDALKMADREKGKPTDRERNRLFGLSTIRQRCLLNNLCSKPNINFLEVGVYKGATLISALFDNPTVKAVGVEHYLYDDRESPKWAPEGFIWDNMKSHLEANLHIYRNEKDRLNTDNIEIIQSAFEEVDWSKQRKFDVVHFDVTPVTEQTYDDFFNLVVPSLATDSVVVFTLQSDKMYAELLNAAVLKHADKVTQTFKEYRVTNSMSDSFNYYSGVAMIGFKKKSVAAVKPKTVPKANVTTKTTGAAKK